MRTTKTGTMLVIGVLGMLLVACGDTDVGIDTSTDTAAQRVDTTLAADPPTLIDELAALGVDIDAAPPAAVEPNGATFCGTADARTRTAIDSPDTNDAIEGPRQCFVDLAHGGGIADLIEAYTSVEGDPIVVVWRTSGGTDDRVHRLDTRRLRLGHLARPGVPIGCARDRHVTHLQLSSLGRATVSQSPRTPTWNAHLRSGPPRHVGAGSRVELAGQGLRGVRLGR